MLSTYWVWSGAEVFKRLINVNIVYFKQFCKMNICVQKHQVRNSRERSFSIFITMKNFMDFDTIDDTIAEQFMEIRDHF